MKKSSLVMLFASVVLLMATACRSREEPTAVVITVVATPTSVTVAPEATSESTAPPTPTIGATAPIERPTIGATDSAATVAPGLTPTAAEPDGPQRVNFEPGATSATLMGRAAAGGKNSYVVRATEGQRMTTSLASDTNDAILGITGPGGLVIAGVLDTILPATGDYVLTIFAGPNDTNYTLIVNIEGDLPPNEPIRINFEPGATSATFSGTVAAGGTVAHVLAATEGQRMTTSVSSDTNEVLLGLVGPGGVQYISVPDSTLHATGDYFLTVYGGDSDANYTFTVSVFDQPPGSECFPQSMAPQGEFCFAFVGQPLPNDPDTIDLEMIRLLDETGAPAYSVEVPERTLTPKDSNSLVVEDMNYDGYDDFRVVELLPAGANIPYLYYMYDQATDQFVYNEPFRTITSPEFPGNGEVLSPWNVGAGYWGIDTFILVDGFPALVKREEWEVINDTEASHRIMTFDAATGSGQVILDQVGPIP